MSGFEESNNFSESDKLFHDEKKLAQQKKLRRHRSGLPSFLFKRIRCKPGLGIFQGGLIK